MSACTASCWLAACLILVPGPSGRSELPVAPGQENAKPACTDRYGDPLPEGAVARLGTLRFRQRRGFNLRGNRCSRTFRGLASAVGVVAEAPAAGHLGKIG